MGDLDSGIGDCRSQRAVQARHQVAGSEGTLYSSGAIIEPVCPTLESLSRSIPGPHCVTNSKTNEVDIKQDSLAVAYKVGGEVIMKGKLHASVKTDDAMWTLVDNKVF